MISCLMPFLFQYLGIKTLIIRDGSFTSLSSRLKKDAHNVYITHRTKFRSLREITLGRIGVLTAFAVIGFFLGIAAYYMGKNLTPWLEKVSPLLINVDWIIAGVIGAIVTVIVVVVWSYTTKS